MFFIKKVVPGSEIWTPQSPILNAVGKQSVDYDSRIFRIDSNGTVSAEMDLFAAGYCLIFPKYYPKDQHICLFPLALRTGVFQSICLLVKLTFLKLRLKRDIQSNRGSIWFHNKHVSSKMGYCWKYGHYADALR